MDDLRVARLEVDRRDPFPFGQARRQDEDAELVAPLGARACTARDGRQDQVGRAERPVGGPLARRRGVARVPLGAARLDPGRERRDLGLREHPRVAERPPLLGRRRPGGHRPRLGHLRDVGGPLAGLLVGQQRERRHLAGPVAVLAVLLEDPHDLAVIRRHPPRGTSPDPSAAARQSDRHPDSSPAMSSSNDTDLHRLSSSRQCDPSASPRWSPTRSHPFR